MNATITAATVSVLAQDIDVVPTIPDNGVGEKVTMLLGWLMWGCIVAAIGGVMICGAMLAYEKISGGHGGATGKLVGGLVGAIIIGSAAGLINGLVLN